MIRTLPCLRLAESLVEILKPEATELEILLVASRIQEALKQDEQDQKVVPIAKCLYLTKTPRKI